jgi:transcriptional regulator with XRE-family HTH domain
MEFNIKRLVLDTVRRRTVGETLSYLRTVFLPRSKDLYAALNTTPSTYLKVERGKRELSLIMAVRLCRFYGLELEEFLGLLAPSELERKDLSSIKWLEKNNERILEVNGE